MQRFESDTIDAAAAEICRLLIDAKQVVAFTGAGVSTDSGIPDFRSPGGVWSRNRTVYFRDFLRSEEDRFEYWRQKAEAHSDFLNAKPNIIHQTLAEWEHRGLLRGVITQNIDGLHQAAGSRHVLELHGTAMKVACLKCPWQDDADPWVQRFVKEQRVPVCPECGGLIKHATISFGQSLSTDVLREANEWAKSADVFLAFGSSLVVEPAASLPTQARHFGARLVIANRDSTPLDPLADIVVNAPLTPLIHAIRKTLPEN